MGKACQGIYPLHDVHTRIASDGLKGRVYEVSLADLKDVVNKLIPDSIARDIEKACQGIYPLHDVKTTDGYTLRLFCIGFTRKQEMSTKKTAYAQAGQVRNIRKKMIDIISREVSSTDLKDVVNKLIPDSIARDIEKACQGVYPLHDVHIRKVKVM